MADKIPPRAGKRQSPGREDRLKSALKANLARRKAQARARANLDTAQTGDKKDKD
jgi:hypothetical protein